LERVGGKAEETDAALTQTQLTGDRFHAPLYLKVVLNPAIMPAGAKTSTELFDVKSVLQSIYPDCANS